MSISPTGPAGAGFIHEAEHDAPGADTAPDAAPDTGRTPPSGGDSFARFRAIEDAARAGDSGSVEGSEGSEPCPLPQDLLDQLTNPTAQTVADITRRLENGSRRERIQIAHWALEKLCVTAHRAPAIARAIIGHLTRNCIGQLSEAKQAKLIEALAGRQIEAPRYEQLTSEQRTRLAALHDEYMTEAHLEHHEAWHAENGPGGTRGSGSGELFVMFHHDMMKGFESFLKQKGAHDLVPLPLWDTTRPIPSEITNGSITRNSNNADFETPSWLTLAGGSEAAPGDIGGVRSLHDIRTADDFGRILGTSGYHARGHMRIGGTMASFRSPADPVFYGWHGHLDQVFLQWMTQTANGRQWALDNADKLGHPPADHGGGGHHGAVGRPRGDRIAMAQPIDFSDSAWRSARGLSGLGLGPGTAIA